MDDDEGANKCASCRDSKLHLHSFTARRGCVILEMEAVHIAVHHVPSVAMPLCKERYRVPELLELLSAMEVRGVLARVPTHVVMSIQVRRGIGTKIPE